MKINRLLFLTIFTILVFCSKIFAQEEETKFEPSGHTYGKIFSNFHYQITSDDQESAFALERAYLGYEYFLSEYFTVNVKLDIGSPNQESSYDILKRYAYFKNAALIYKKEKLSLSFGLIDLCQFKVQEKFWSHRYIYKSFMDEHRFGSSADLGANVTYEFSDFISADLTVMNGEGYNQLQADNTYKSGLGITVLPIKSLTVRFYVDYTEQDKIQTSWSGFIGYKFKKIAKVGVEYNYKKNNKYEKDQNMCGLSSYGSWQVFEKWELFARFDDLKSNIPLGEADNWNLSKDGNTVISGIQFSPIKKIKLALNYQGFVCDDTNKDNISAIYFNLEYKF
jgi:hypothetical protein